MVTLLTFNNDDNNILHYSSKYYNCYHIQNGVVIKCKSMRTHKLLMDILDLYRFLYNLQFNFTFFFFYYWVHIIIIITLQRIHMFRQHFYHYYKLLVIKHISQDLYVHLKRISHIIIKIFFKIILFKYIVRNLITNCFI